ncbi:MAG: UvrD-helicase domain-containing protein [Candidatus Bipolaricaulota bacterium]
MNKRPRGNQNKLIKETEGLYLVDAGAGTGKTFTVTRRYAKLLEQGISPDQIFLATFTENAAENMREEIINYCDYNLSELRDAPISTFHGFCRGLLMEDGFSAPETLGINEHITGNTQTISNKIQENQEFLTFYDHFRESHPEYTEFYSLTYDVPQLLNLIKSLAVKGIFPEREGWYRDGRKQLYGDYPRYRHELKRINQPRSGKRGQTQSQLLRRLTGMKNKTFETEGVVSKNDIKQGKQVDPEVMKEAFREEREELFRFIHDLYFEYVNYALGRNYLNFAFQLMFAFTLLMERHDLRDSRQFEYTMIDEFQDTNEIQFKLALLLSKTGNILAVGDWKQSIFGFQYASIENITNFRKRIKEYYHDINEDITRAPYKLSNIRDVALKRNYRSSQEILDFSETALSVKGNRREKIHLDRDVVSLQAAHERPGSDIASFISEDEIDAILEKLVRVVNSEKYRLGGESLDYENIAIFSRTRSFARELDKRARELEIPVAYEGGAEVFKTDPAIILLAWLRVLDREDSTRGWSVILDDAGYNIDEIKYMLENGNYPPEMLAFRKRLSEAYDIGEISRIVFFRYGHDNTFTDTIIQVLQDTFNVSYTNTGGIVRFIETNIEDGEAYDVDSSRKDAATVQTIHAAKGLEYPVVFIANMNSQSFPSTNTGWDRIFYDDLIGLRQRKVFSEEDAFLYDNLSAYLASGVSGLDYDEERRLLYVAMTRAEKYLFLSAEIGKAGRFFKELDLDPEVIDPDIGKLTLQETGDSKDELQVEKPKTSRPFKRAVTDVTSTSPENDKWGRGPEFGTMIHRFAEDVVRGDISPPFEGKGTKDKQNVYEFIKSLTGELHPEQDVVIPKRKEYKKVVYHGSIDLLHVKKNCVEVIDFKTDEDRSLETEYKKQLDLYKQAVESEYPDRKVKGLIFYTKHDQVVEV